MLLFASTALMCVLVGLLLARGLSRVLPVFTLLILFYIARALCLFGLFSLISRPHYREMAMAFSGADVLLQLLVSVEFCRAIPQPRGTSTLARLGLLAVVYLVAGAVALASSALLPARSPAPADRATFFLAVSFLLLLLAAWKQRLRKPMIYLLAGLAIVDLASSVSQAARSLAAVHRDQQAFLAWSYASASVYLLVLLFWSAQLLWGTVALELPGLPGPDETA